MTAGKASRTPPQMGRPRINADKRFHLRLPNGWEERIDAVLATKETVTDFIRQAVDRELKRRERKKGGDQ